MDNLEPTEVQIKHTAMSKVLPRKSANNLIAVYGSLRKAHYNHKHFDMEYLGTIVIQGFALYAYTERAAYPHAVKTNNQDDRLVVELYNVSDREEARISGMELGANYNKDFFWEGGHRFTIYTIPEGRAKGFIKIPDGDWTKYSKV